MTTTETVPTHMSLAAALAAFQAEAPTFNKSKTAKVKMKTGGEYTYKYADLGDIIPIVGPLMAKHGLSWSAKPAVTEDGQMVLRFTLRHVSNQEDAGEMPLGVERSCKPQELGSAITYMRRYAMTAQLNIATEEDDDAQTAQGSERSGRASNGNGGSRQAESRPAASGSGERIASAAQRGLMNVRASEAELPPSDYAVALLKAAGQPEREFESQEAAQTFVNRQLDRLPARLVDRVLEEIQAMGAPS